MTLEEDQAVHEDVQDVELSEQELKEKEFRDSVADLQADAKTRIARVTRTAHILHFAAHNLIFITVLLLVFSLSALFLNSAVSLLLAISISIPVSSIKKDAVINPIIEELSSLIHSNDVEIIQANGKRIEELVNNHFDDSEQTEEQPTV